MSLARNTLRAAGALLAAAATYAAPRLVLAAGACDSFKDQFDGLFNWVPDRYCTAQGLLLAAINLGLTLAGGAAVLFLIVGGLRYLAAGGDQEASERGKKTLTNALIGLVVVLLATMIVRVVSRTITGGSGGGTTPGGTQGGGTPGGGTQGGGSVGAIVSNARTGFPDELTPGQNATFTFDLNPQRVGGLDAARSGISQACGGVAFSNTSLVLKINGTEIYRSPFSVNGPNSLSATITRSVPSNLTSPVVATLHLCGGTEVGRAEY